MKYSVVAELVSDVVSLHDRSNSRRGPFMVDTLSVRYSCVTQMWHGLLTSSFYQIQRYFPIPIRSSDKTLQRLRTSVQVRQTYVGLSMVG